MQLVRVYLVWVILCSPVCGFVLCQKVDAEPASAATRVLKAARRSVGKRMWKDGYGLRDGRLGCAASVSSVLKLAGLKHVHSPVTKWMRGQILKGPVKARQYTLKNGGDGPVDDAHLKKIARPGDVLIAFMRPLPKANIGPSAHCGVMGEGGMVFTNDWNDGIWKHASIHDYFDSYKYMYLLRFQ